MISAGLVYPNEKDPTTPARVTRPQPNIASQIYCRYAHAKIGFAMG